MPASGQTYAIALSKRAFFYFATYHFWQFFKKVVWYALIAMVAITAYRLISSSRIFGMSDAEIAREFAAPLPMVALAVCGATLLYGIIRGVMSAKTTHYTASSRGLIIETGWWTRKTVILDYSQIQKMTIVTNPFDRIFHSRYIYLELIGGGPGVILEAVNAAAVESIQKRLTNSMRKLGTANKHLQELGTAKSGQKSPTYKRRKATTHQAKQTRKKKP